MDDRGKVLYEFYTENLLSKYNTTCDGWFQLSEADRDSWRFAAEQFSSRYGAIY